MIELKVIKSLLLVLKSLTVFNDYFLSRDYFYRKFIIIDVFFYHIFGAETSYRISDSHWFSETR